MFNPWILPCAISLLLCSGTLPAAAYRLHPSHYATHKVTCEQPVKLTRDCSIWRGATRQIRIAGYNMSVAADQQGQTLLVVNIHRQRNNAGLSMGFSFGGGSTKNRNNTLRQGIGHLTSAIAQQGPELQRLVTMGHGHIEDGYFLHYTEDAYRHLEPYTVLQQPLPAYATRR